MTTANYVTRPAGTCEGCGDDVAELHRLATDRNGAEVCSAFRPDVWTDAERVGFLAIDTVHGCHLNAHRFEVLDYLTEAATSVNADPEVVGEVGILPLPLAMVEHDAAATTVAYADGSAIRFTWGDDGYAVNMAVHPIIGRDTPHHFA